MRKVWKEVIWMVIFIDLIWVTSGAVMTFSLQETNLCPTIGMNKEVKVTTKVQCSAICLMEVDCQGICYHSDMEICRTFSIDLTSSRGAVSSDPGFKMFWAEQLDGFRRIWTKAYFVDPVGANFWLAQANCSSKGAKMVFPQNQEEKDMLATLTTQSYWISMDDLANEGQFVNSYTGEAATYFKWSPGEPNGGTIENCVFIYIDGDFIDEICSRAHVYICEKLV